MNCKQGDLAIIVKSLAGNEGKIVRCVRFIGNDDAFMYGDRWEIDVQLQASDGTYANSVSDSHMRPLRGDLLNDEITNTKELETL